MIRVGLATTEPGYAGLAPPFGPGKAFPELDALLGASVGEGPPNHVYAAVREALRALGLDGERFGSPHWNPLGALVARGGRVVLKPNFIRHWNPNPRGTLASVITHGAVLRAIADYALLAVGSGGSVVLAEAPQQDCDWSEIRARVGLDEIAGFYERQLGLELPLLDLRQEAVEFRDGIIVRRVALAGDPAGYRVVDLGEQSFFAGSGLDPQRMRGADYDPAVTADHHRGGRNEYLLSETVLRSDLIVNLPKLKTHKKTGVTLALKNLVGINGDKNWLPHHCAGPVDEGGDEFPGRRLVDRARSRATDWAREHLKSGRLTGLLRAARRLERSTRGTTFLRSGNWHGNRTTWRMCLDLNRCVYWSDTERLRLDAAGPRRRVLTVLDGVVAGEGEGPLAPDDVALGVVLASTDPVALDLAAVRLMGFDADRIPKLREAMRDPGPRITAVRRPEDVRVFESRDGMVSERQLHELAPRHRFRPHDGWIGHIEGDPR